MRRVHIQRAAEARTRLDFGLDPLACQGKVLSPRQASSGSSSVGSRLRLLRKEGAGDATAGHRGVRGVQLEPEEAPTVT